VGAASCSKVVTTKEIGRGNINACAMVCDGGGWEDELTEGGFRGIWLCWVDKVYVSVSPLSNVSLRMQSTGDECFPRKKGNLFSLVERRGSNEIIGMHDG